MKNIFKFIGKALLVVATIWFCLFGLVLVVDLVSSIDSGIDSAVETITGVELTEGGHAKPKTVSNSNDIDTPIKLDTTKSSSDVEKRPTPVVEEVRPEPVVPNEVLKGEVYVSQQINMNGDDYYIISRAKYVTGGYSSDGAPFGVVLSDGSIGESGCYDVIIEVMPGTMTLHDGAGFTNEVQKFKFSTEENYNAYKNYINGNQSQVESNTEPMVDHSANNLGDYEIGDIIEVDRNMFHVVRDELYDGYREITFGIGDMGPYVIVAWDQDREIIPDYNNMDVINLEMVDDVATAYFEGDYVDSFEFEFIQ